MARAAWRPQEGSWAQSRSSGTVSKQEEEGTTRTLRKNGTNEDVAGAKDRVRRGRRRRNEDKDRSIATKDKGLKELLTVMMKQLSIVSQQSRLLMATQCDKFLVSHSSKLIEAMQAEGTAFARMVDKMRERRDNGDERAAKQLEQLGPPTATVAMAFLAALNQQDVGGANRQAIKDFFAKAEPAEGVEPEVTKSMIEDWITVCRIESVYDENKRMITLAMRTFPLRQHIVSAMTMIGHPPMRGVAPPGYLEEEVSAWIEAMNKQ
mmetsp:Transcript_35005/g.99953  ORF Transcript_35005/g.99953 Transcript_35005/m.99953 type:complete len:264 (-) Transcript_35005:235-1026(-)